jgi:hypothetical protein
MLTSEPFYIRQSCAPRTSDEKRAWLESCAAESRAQGATFARASHHPDNCDLLLFEAWKARPDEQGPLRWNRN